MKIQLPAGAQFSYFDDNVIYRGAEYEGMVPVGTIDPLVFDRALCESYQASRRFICSCANGFRYATKPGGAFDQESARLKEASPITLVDWITLQCNYRCSYCYTHSPAWTKKHPSAKTKTLRSAVDRRNMVRLIMDNVEGYMRYQMIGGEPLMMGNWAEIAEEVTSIENVRFSLYTNASMPDRMAPLLKGQLDPAKVEVVMAMHPTQKGFNADEFLRTAVALRCRGYGLTIIAVNLPINEPWLSENEKIFKELGLPVSRYEDVRPTNPGFQIKGVLP
jgi:MoaA/NifB/PqqE/SkfB family radical SAM enzyme